MNPENRNRILTCIALFLLNFILKFSDVSSTDIGLDEPFTIFNAQRNLTGIIELLKTDNNPPLHLFIMHFWINWFGNGLVSARFLSVVFSSLAAVALFLSAARHFSYRTGLIASLIFTASNLQMFYAHDARVYSLFMLLSILNLNSFLNFIYSEKKNTNKSIIIFTLINILLCYAHFFGFVILLVETIVCLIATDFRRHFTKLIISSTVVIVTFLWYIPIIIDRFKITTSGNWIPFPVITDLYTMIWRFSNVPVFAVLFILVTSIVLSLKWNLLNKEPDKKVKISLLMFLISYLLLFFISFKIPVFIDRYLLFTSAYFYILVSVAFLNMLKSRNWNFYISIILTIVLFFTLDLKRGKKESTKEMAEFVAQNTKIPTNIIITPQWFDLNTTYYLKPEWFNNVGHLQDSLVQHQIFAVNKAENIPGLGSNNPAILIDNSGQENSVRSFMISNYKIRSERAFGGNLRVILFDPKN